MTAAALFRGGFFNTFPIARRLYVVARGRENAASSFKEVDNCDKQHGET
jgi:hypothetical protein